MRSKEATAKIVSMFNNAEPIERIIDEIAGIALAFACHEVLGTIISRRVGYADGVKSVVDEQHHKWRSFVAGIAGVVPPKLVNDRMFFDIIRHEYPDIYNTWLES